MPGSSSDDAAAGRPDFDWLFLVNDGEDGEDGWFTPQLAARLWLAAVLLADEYLEDPESYEQRLPPIALDRGDEFAARLHQAACELRNDIERGHSPRPRSTGEAVVLGWIVDDTLAATGGEDETTTAEVLESLTRTDYDTDDAHRDVSGLYDALFEDLDFETLYSPELDGLDASAQGRELGMESLRPADWFVPYSHLAEVLPARPEFETPARPLVFTLEAKVSFRITDPQAVHDAAIALLTDPGTHFDSDQARDEEITRVQLSLTDALLTLVDAGNALVNIPSARDDSSVVGIETGNTT